MKPLRERCVLLLCTSLNRNWQNYKECTRHYSNLFYVSIHHLLSIQKKLITPM